MSTFLQQTVNGLSLGSIYVLVGVGLTLVLGVSRVMHYGQGQFVVLGGYLAFALVGAGIGWWLGLGLAVLAVAGIAVVLYLALLRPIATDPLATFIVTLGVGIVVEQLLIQTWGPMQRQIDSPFGGGLSALGVTLSGERLVLLLTCVPVVGGLVWLLARTHAGRAMRATAESRETAALMGIDVHRTAALTFALGSGLAAVAGPLLGTLFPFTPFSGGAFVVKGLAIALAGGAGSVTGAVVVGLALGLVETYASGYELELGFAELGPQWRDGYAFLLLIGILAWRPQGLFRGTGAI